MDKLRDEILEAQKMRADLIKWKLVLVAGLSAAGLGLHDAQRKVALLLCLIPFVCVYVDIVARHLNLRIHVIAEYLRRQTGDPDSAYEVFAGLMAKKNVFTLETGVLWYSTLFLSLMVILAGYGMWGELSIRDSVLFMLSGLFGIAAAPTVDVIYRRKLKAIVD